MADGPSVAGRAEIVITANLEDFADLETRILDMIGGAIKVPVVLDDSNASSSGGPTGSHDADLPGATEINKREGGAGAGGAGAASYAAIGQAVRTAIQNALNEGPLTVTVQIANADKIKGDAPSDHGTGTGTTDSRPASNDVRTLQLPQEIRDRLARDTEWQGAIRTLHVGLTKGFADLGKTFSSIDPNETMPLERLKELINALGSDPNQWLRGKKTESGESIIDRDSTLIKYMQSQGMTEDQAVRVAKMSSILQVMQPSASAEGSGFRSTRPIVPVDMIAPMQRIGVTYGSQPSQPSGEGQRSDTTPPRVAENPPPVTDTRKPATATLPKAQPDIPPDLRRLTAKEVAALLPQTPLEISKPNFAAFGRSPLPGAGARPDTGAVSIDYLEQASAGQLQQWQRERAALLQQQTQQRRNITNRIKKLPPEVQAVIPTGPGGIVPAGLDSALDMYQTAFNDAGRRIRTLDRMIRQRSTVQMDVHPEPSMMRGSTPGFIAEDLPSFAVNDPQRDPARPVSPGGRLPTDQEAADAARLRGDRDLRYGPRADSKTTKIGNWRALSGETNGIPYDFYPIVSMLARNSSNNFFKDEAREGEIVQLTPKGIKPDGTLAEGVTLEDIAKQQALIEEAHGHTNTPVKYPDKINGQDVIRELKPASGRDVLIGEINRMSREANGGKGDPAMRDLLMGVLDSDQVENVLVHMGLGRSARGVSTGRSTGDGGGVGNSTQEWGPHGLDRQFRHGFRLKEQVETFKNLVEERKGLVAELEAISDEIYEKEETTGRDAPKKLRDREASKMRRLSRLDDQIKRTANVIANLQEVAGRIEPTTPEEDRMQEAVAKESRALNRQMIAKNENASAFATGRAPRLPHHDRSQTGTETARRRGRFERKQLLDFLGVDLSDVPDDALEIDRVAAERAAVDKWWDKEIFEPAKAEYPTMGSRYGKIDGDESRRHAVIGLPDWQTLPERRTGLFSKIPTVARILETLDQMDMSDQSARDMKGAVMEILDISASTLISRLQDKHGTRDGTTTRLIDTIEGNSLIGAGPSPQFMEGRGPHPSIEGADFDRYSTRAEREAARSAAVREYAKRPETSIEREAREAKEQYDALYAGKNAQTPGSVTLAGEAAERARAKELGAEWLSGPDGGWHGYSMSVRQFNAELKAARKAAETQAEGGVSKDERQKQVTAAKTRVQEVRELTDKLVNGLSEQLGSKDREAVLGAVSPTAARGVLGDEPTDEIIGLVVREATEMLGTNAPGALYSRNRGALIPRGPTVNRGRDLIPSTKTRQRAQAAHDDTENLGAIEPTDMSYQDMLQRETDVRTFEAEHAARVAAREQAQPEIPAVPQRVYEIDAQLKTIAERRAKYEKVEQELAAARAKADASAQPAGASASSPAPVQDPVWLKMKAEYDAAEKAQQEWDRQHGELIGQADAKKTEAETLRERLRTEPGGLGGSYVLHASTSESMKVGNKLQNRGDGGVYQIKSIAPPGHTQSAHGPNGVVNFSACAACRAEAAAALGEAVEETPDDLITMSRLSGPGETEMVRTRGELLSPMTYKAGIGAEVPDMNKGAWAARTDMEPSHPDLDRLASEERELRQQAARMTGRPDLPFLPPEPAPTVASTEAPPALPSGPDPRLKAEADAKQQQLDFLIANGGGPAALDYQATSLQAERAQLMQKHEQDARLAGIGLVGSDGGRGRPPGGRPAAADGGAGDGSRGGLLPSGGGIHVIVDEILKASALEGLIGGNAGPQTYAEAAPGARAEAVGERARFRAFNNATTAQFVQAEVKRLMEKEGLDEKQVRARFKPYPELAPHLTSVFAESDDGSGRSSAATASAARNARRQRLGLAPLEERDDKYYEDMNAADDTRASLSARARRAARGIPSRGFGPTMTDMFANIGGFLDKQVAAVSRFQLEGTQLAAMERKMPRLEYEQRTREEEYNTAVSGQQQAQAAYDAAKAAKEPKSVLNALKQSLDQFTKDVAATKEPFENASRVLKDAQKELGQDVVDREGNPTGLAEPTGQYRRVADAEAALPGVKDRVAAFGIGAAANIASITIGNMLAQVGLQIAGAIGSVVAGGIGKIMDPIEAQLTGFSKALDEATESLSEASRATSANMEMAVAETAAKVGLSSSTYGWLGSTIGQRGMAEAGNRTLQEQTEFMRGVEASINAERRGANGQPVGWFQPPGGIPGLTRNTGGILGSPVLGTPSTWEMIQKESPLDRTMGVGLDFLATSIGRLTGLPIGNPGGMGAVADEFNNMTKFSAARLDELGKAAERGGSELVFLANSTDEQKKAFREAAVAIGVDPESFIAQGLTVGRTGTGAAPITKEDFEAFLRAIEKGTLMGTPDAMLASLAGREGQAWMGQLEAQSALQLRSNSAAFGMNWMAAPPVRLEDALFPGGMNAATGQANLGSSYGGDFSQTALINPGAFTIPQEVFDSYTKFQPLAAEVFGEIDSLAQKGIENLKEFGLTDEQISKVVSYGSAIKDLQQDMVGQQWAAGIEDYNYSLMIAKRNVGDLVGLNDRNNAKLADGNTVQATALGVQQRIVLEKSREATLLSQQLQQRQINFQMATAGFGTEGLTSAEIAARRRQAQYEARIAQRQLNIQKDITQAEIKIVDEQNLRALRGAIRDVDKMVRDFKIQIEMKGQQALLAGLESLRSKILSDTDVTINKYKAYEEQAISTAAAMRKLTDESFSSLLSRARSTIASIKRDLSAAYSEIPGSEGSGTGQTAHDRERGIDTGGPGDFIPSSSGVIVNGPMVQFVGDITVRSEADLDAIGAAVEGHLNRQSALRGLRTPVIF